MMQLKRWITAIIALPFLIALVYRGHPFLFSLFVSLVFILAQWEYYRIVSGIRNGKSNRFISGLGFTIGLMIIWAAYAGTAELMIGLLAVNLIVSGLIAFFYVGPDPKIFDTLFKQAMGTLYVPLLLSFLILIRSENNGIGWLFFLMAVIFSGDSLAYYGGTYLGRRKLCPRVSPGKTIEGSAAGLFFLLTVSPHESLSVAPRVVVRRSTIRSWAAWTSSAPRVLSACRKTRRTARLTCPAGTGWPL